MALDLGLSGLASGFDWKSFVDQMVDVERAPQQRLLREQTSLNQRNNVYSNIKSQLTTLQSRMAALKSESLFETRAARSSDSTVATASVSSGAAQGAYTFHISQLATSSKIAGQSNVAGALNEDADVNDLTLSSAGFPVAVSGGTFTVNGKQVTIATSDTLGGVFAKISAATGGEVTAAYDPDEDKITLTGSGTVILGSATDTSNFLQASRLSNNGTSSISSSLALGSVKTGATLDSANLSAVINDGGAGEGRFKINGVEIAFNASTDTVSSVLDRINNSQAQVTASYDPVNDRFLLTSRATGDIGIALEDVAGNFLAATGLSADSGATLQRGKDLLYTINGGDQLRSHSNTITEASSGIKGLSVSALKENATVTLTSSTDTTAIKTAIQSFMDAYNKVQSLIDSQTASSTDSQGVVSAGVLNGDRDIEEVASRLRAISYGEAGSGTTLRHLADLGIVTNGNDDTLRLEDATLLDDALTNNMESVKQLFANSTNGLAAKLDDYLNRVVGENGSLISHQNRLSQQAGQIDQQLLDMERMVQANKERLTASFVSMETAQANLNQQLQYLMKNLGSA